MLTIQRAQQDKFRDARLRSFHDALICDIREHFPVHYSVLGETTLHDVISYGIERSWRYGIVSECSVAQYVNCMLMLGSNFDNDALLPWVPALLCSTQGQDPDDRMEDLSLAVLDYLNRIAGPDNFSINRALLSLRTGLEPWLGESLSTSLGAALEQGFMRFFPMKFREVEGPLLERFEAEVPDAAGQYGLSSRRSFRLYGMMMFMLGSAFDKDPALPLIRQALSADGYGGETSRFNRLLRSALNLLDHFCDQRH